MTIPYPAGLPASNLTARQRDYAERGVHLLAAGDEPCWCGANTQSANRFREAEDLRSLVTQTVGAASLGLWDGEEATGVFRDQEAIKVADEAYDRALQLIRRSLLDHVAAHGVSESSLLTWTP